MARALISCSDENELSGGYCSPLDGSCGKSSENDPAGVGESRREAPWFCCKSVADKVADKLRDVSCADCD
jgi:hypothetical protein